MASLHLPQSVSTLQPAWSFQNTNQCFLQGLKMKVERPPTPNPAAAPCWSWNDTQASCDRFLGPLAHGRLLPTPQHPGLPPVSRLALAGASAWGSLHDLCKPGSLVHPGLLSPVTFSREAIRDLPSNGHHAMGSPPYLATRFAFPPSSSDACVILFVYLRCRLSLLPTEQKPGLSHALCVPSAWTVSGTSSMSRCLIVSPE